MTEREKLIKARGFAEDSYDALTFELEEGEFAFWMFANDEMIRAFAEEFGRKYTPQKWGEGRDIPIGPADWDVLVDAVRHVQSYCAHISDVVEDITENWV